MSFGSATLAATKKERARGARTVEVRKQSQHHPMAVEHQVMVNYAVTNGFLDTIPVNRLKDWEKGFLEFMDKQFPQVPQKIRSDKVLSKETEADLRRALDSYNQSRTPKKP